MSPKRSEEVLYNDLLSIYARAGAEVTYETDDGKIKPYWAKRFLQAVKRAEKQAALFEFVRRLVCVDEDSRGFLILKKAGRLDLTVEALIADKDRPYNGDIDFDVIKAARERLMRHDYPYALSRNPSMPDGISVGAEADSEVPPTLSPGSSFDVRITVGEGGKLSLSLM
jgi:hypothetical protein